MGKSIRIYIDTPRVISPEDLAAMLRCVGLVNAAEFIGHPPGSLLCVGPSLADERINMDLLRVDEGPSMYRRGDFNVFNDWKLDHAA